MKKVYINHTTKQLIARHNSIKTLPVLTVFLLSFDPPLQMNQLPEVTSDPLVLIVSIAKTPHQVILPSNYLMIKCGTKYN